MPSDPVSEACPAVEKVVVVHGGTAVHPTDGEPETLPECVGLMVLETHQTDLLLEAGLSTSNVIHLNKLLTALQTVSLAAQKAALTSLFRKPSPLDIQL